MHQNCQVVLSVFQIAISKSVQWIRFVFNVFAKLIGYALCVMRYNTHAHHKRLESFPIN